MEVLHHQCGPPFYRNSERISMHYIVIQKGFLCILSEFGEDFYALYRNSGFYLHIVSVLDWLLN